MSSFPESGFTTIVLSDLHLTEEQIPDPKNNLWKKFKTKKFSFDQEFSDMLNYQMEVVDGRIELVLNGDIFDFDSVTKYPEKPTFKVSRFEKTNTMYSQLEKSIFKMEVIIKDHPIWFGALTKFVKAGHRLVFTIGNHDLELHYEEVQRIVRKVILNNPEGQERIRFCEWFYISHKDTHIEHGQQYDPFCVCQTPVNPFIKVHNDIRVRIPFGNMATRYMVNKMGFINPHSEENYSMTLMEYMNFFFKFLIRRQPLIIWTWFSSAVVIAYRSILYRLREPVSNPLAYEEKVEAIAEKSNASPKIVRELLTLATPSAVSSPWSIMQVLWMDRALLFLIGIGLTFQFFLIVDQLIDVQFYWMLIPLLGLAPFFIFYSSTVKNRIKGSKNLSGDRMRWVGLVTGANRVIFGHTHEVKHEIVGLIEYLNPGSWSPVFEDYECKKSLAHYLYVKICPEDSEEGRVAYLNEWKDGQEIDYYTGKKFKN